MDEGGTIATPTLEALLRGIGTTILDGEAHPVDPSIPALAWSSWWGLDARTGRGRGEGRTMAPRYKIRGQATKEGIKALLGDGRDGSDGSPVRFADVSVTFEHDWKGTILTGEGVARPIDGDWGEARLDPAHDGRAALVEVRDGESGLAEMTSLLDDIASLGRIDPMFAAWRREDGRIMPPAVQHLPTVIFATRQDPARSMVSMGNPYWVARRGPNPQQRRRHQIMAERWEVQALDRIVAWYAPRSISEPDRHRTVGVRAKPAGTSSATLAAAASARRRNAAKRIATFLERTGAHPSLAQACLEDVDKRLAAARHA